MTGLNSRWEFFIFTKNEGMLKATFSKHTFLFKRPGGTSRGVLTTKDSWHIKIYREQTPGVFGIGECSILKGLSIDDRSDFEDKLKEVVTNIHKSDYWLDEGLVEFPAIRFGLETALTDLENNGKRELFSSDFLSGKKGMPINGLVWMGDYEFMREQIIQKVEAGYRCIKLKIGAINFEDELNLLQLIRNDFNAEELELRVDANGAFSNREALGKLKRLSEYNIHSIEQPIQQGQWEEMAELSELSPLPIALDEELIGISDKGTIKKMLETIKPRYIILKPGLLGGFNPCEMFIKEAKQNNIGWWVTSALEGNIGLNAIAQWTATLNNEMPQGLGTGQLFKNNIESPLYIKEAKLFHDPKKEWNLSQVFDE